MLSDQAVLCLSALLAARDEAQEAHDETREWRELEDFTASLRVRLVYHKHIEKMRDPNGSDMMVYRITQKGVDALKAQQSELERPKAKRGPNKPKAAVQETPSQKIRNKIQSFNPAMQKEIGSAINAQANGHKPMVSRDIAPEAHTPVPLLPESEPADYVEPSKPIIMPLREPDAVIDFRRLASHADGCEDCVYHEAVEILAKRVPGVGELVEALKAIRTVGK